jgi:hypothetical protein
MPPHPAPCGGHGGMVDDGTGKELAGAAGEELAGAAGEVAGGSEPSGAEEAVGDSAQGRRSSSVQAGAPSLLCRLGAALKPLATADPWRSDAADEVARRVREERWRGVLRTREEGAGAGRRGRCAREEGEAGDSAARFRAGAGRGAVRAGRRWRAILPHGIEGIGGRTKRNDSMGVSPAYPDLGNVATSFHRGETFFLSLLPISCKVLQNADVAYY